MSSRQRVSLICILFSFFSNITFAYHLISPSEHTIVRSNFFKCQIGLDLNDPDPDSAFFYITQQQRFAAHPVLKIDADSHLTHVHECHNIVDGLLFVRAEVWSMGRLTELTSQIDERGIMLILDRHLEYKSLTVTCQRYRSGTDMEQYRHALFKSNNNQVDLSACWDNDSLYLMLWVADAHLNYIQNIEALAQAPYFKSPLWYSDGIEICLDMLHDHQELRQLDDYELMVDIAGRSVFKKWDRRLGQYKNWGAQSRISVVTDGSVNQNVDRDAGYRVDISIPWTDLDVVPEKNQTYGFDVQNFDRDSETGEEIRTIWSGTDLGNNDNTSEWGNLVLTSDTGIGYWIYIYVLVFIAGLLFFPVMKKIRLLKQQHHLQEPGAKIQEVRDFIEKEYQNPELTRSTIARHAGLSEWYLSTRFKVETGETLNSYIHRIRIEHAKMLLKESDQSISQIAFECGYNNLQNFLNHFKKSVGKTPTEYRGNC